MATVKNEHIVYAYAPLFDGGNLLLVGITDHGWKYLKKESGNYLHASPPGGQFSNVSQVWVVRGKDKQEIREMILSVAQQMGVTINFAH